MAIRIISILCPKCGAGVKFFENDRVIHCIHCGMNFLPAHSEGVERYFFTPQISNVKSSLESYLSSCGLNMGDYSIIDIDNFFIPVWRGNGQIIGWLAGISPLKQYEYTETVSTPTGGQVQVKRKRHEGGIPLKKLLRINKEMLFNAVRFPDLRWRREEVLKPEYEPFLRVFDQSTMNKWGKILTADSSPLTEKKEMKRRFIESSLALYHDYDPLRNRLKVIDHRVFIYYFPLSLARVKINDTIIGMTVNGVSGRVTSNSPIERKVPTKSTPSFLLDTITVLLSSIVSSFLIHSEFTLYRQCGIVIPMIVLLYLWIRR
jgi:hypothetical protein